MAHMRAAAKRKAPAETAAEPGAAGGSALPAVGVAGVCATGMAITSEPRAADLISSFGVGAAGAHGGVGDGATDGDGADVEEAGLGGDEEEGGGQGTAGGAAGERQAGGEHAFGAAAQASGEAAPMRVLDALSASGAPLSAAWAVPSARAAPALAPPFGTQPPPPAPALAVPLPAPPPLSRAAPRPLQR